MIVYVNEHFKSGLKDAHNFREFKIQIAAGIGHFDYIWKNLDALLAFEDDATAWVSVDELISKLSKARSSLASRT